MPGVPTVGATLPGFEVLSWLGLAAPAGTPDAVIRLLNAETRRALQDPELQKTLADLGSQAAPNSPQEMRAMVEQDIVRWRAVVDKAGIARQ